jgi:hypothetical protein
MPPGYLHPPLQREKGDEQHGEAADEHVRERVGGVDVRVR